MMKSKLVNSKGFTLIELIGTLIVISIIMVIAVPSITDTLKRIENRSYDIEVKNIENLAKTWLEENIETFNITSNNAINVSTKMLVSLGYISKTPVNPKKKGKKLNGCIRITYNNNNSQYSYSYDNENIDCSNREDGYYFDYIDEKWELNSSYAENDLFDEVIANNDLQTTQDGLYIDGNTYYFRGNNVNNYVDIDGTIFRIVSLNKDDKTIKLIRTTPLVSSGNMWDTENKATDFRSSSLSESLLSLEDSYSNYLSKQSKWNIGPVSTLDTDISSIQTYERRSQVILSVGLLGLSEYLRASNNDKCIVNSLNNNCLYNNYLSSYLGWTLTNNGSKKAYYLNDTSILTDSLTTIHKAYPSIVINSSNVVMKNETIDGSLKRVYALSTDSE